LPALNARTAEAYAMSYGTATAASAPTANAFWLRIVPQGAMTNDRCGTFALTNTGQKTDATGSGGSASCWDR
jgi:type IV pilus assembly protein PilE